MSFYEWLIKLSQTPEHKADFADTMDGLGETKQHKIFHWLKFAYLEGYYQGSFGNLPEEDQDELGDAELSVEEKSDSVSFLLKTKVKQNSEKLLKNKD